MAKKTNTKEVREVSDTAVVSSTMTQDLKNSVLIVSVVLNLVVFTMWIALQITSRYDFQLASFLLNR